MIYSELKARKDGKRMEQKLIEAHVKTLYEEIELREKQIADLLNKYKQIDQDCQDIADEMLGLEYEALVKAGQ